MAYRNSSYIDKSGFHFDLPPINALYQDPAVGFINGESNDYGEGIYEIGTHNTVDVSPDQYTGWLNWMDKYQPDARFMSFSDKNAEARMFPNVDSPWMFTQYFFESTASGNLIVEPEYYWPTSFLSEGILNAPSGKRIKSEILSATRSAYLYQCDAEDCDEEKPEMEWEQLKWVCICGNTSFKKGDYYGQRWDYDYPAENSGVRLYRQTISVRSTKWGQHGNIPPNTINMTAPKEWIEPSGVDGKKTKSGAVGSEQNVRIDRGSGKNVLDTFDNKPYEGTDPTFYGDPSINNMAKMNTNVMHCFRFDKCNLKHGPSMTHDLIDDVYAGVGEDADYCRYYWGNVCPWNNTPRRAQEYDYNYRKAMDNVLLPFRSDGIDAFGLEEYEIKNDGSIEKVIYASGIPASGQYVACGTFGPDVEYIEAVPSGSQNAYFYYTKSQFRSDHKESDVFVHIKQYNHENQQVYMNPPSGVVLPSGYPAQDSIPWLVKLHDDYKKPTGFPLYITNEEPFMGGRHPEYRDMSKRKAEIQCEVGTGAGYWDSWHDPTYDGKGGFTAQPDGGFKAVADMEYKYKMGYWPDKWGEWITDGRELGGAVDKEDEGRKEVIPSLINGATPIDGEPGNTTIDPVTFENKRPIIKRAHIYSSDTTALLNDPYFDDYKNENDVPCRPRRPIAGTLPSERVLYVCETCGQEFSETEAEEYSYTCPKCEFNGDPDGILPSGYWNRFLPCHAVGEVSVWGLPGMSVTKDSYYWKNPTVVNRAMIGQILGKLGEPNPDGGGYSFDTFSGDQEKAMIGYPLPSGKQYEEGLPEKENGEYIDTVASGTYQNFSHNLSMLKDALSEVENISNENLSGTNVDDRIIAPYNTVKVESGTTTNEEIKHDGLEMVTLNHIKKLRNQIMPMFAYSIGDNQKVLDMVGRHQRSYHDRWEYDEITGSKMGKPGTLPVQVLAANTNGAENYLLQWDGYSPPEYIYHYIPTGRIWWRINNVVGGIVRKNGIDANHFDDTTPKDSTHSYRYTGDKLVSKAFYFLHGYIPLDKEIVKAYVITEPLFEPSFKSLGFLWITSNFAGFGQFEAHAHYHAWDTDHEADRTINPQTGSPYNGWHMYYDRSTVTMPGAKSYLMPNPWAGLLSDSEDRYEIQLADIQPPSLIDDSYNPEQITDGLKFVFDTSWGRGDGWNSKGQQFPAAWSDYLEWGGHGTDIEQKFTEEKLWKYYTYDEFDELSQKYTLDCTFGAGDEEVEMDFKVMAQHFIQDVIPHQMQPINGMLSLSGINSSLRQAKNIKKVDKETNTAWAEEGQVVIQNNSRGFRAVPQTDSDPAGGDGIQNAGWVPRVMDITPMLQKRYNSRDDKFFTTSLGKTWDEIKSSTKDDNDAAVAKLGIDADFNYRYIDNTYGIMINDGDHYPTLSANDELTGEDYKDGDELFADPESRIYSVSDYYDETHHPYKLTTLNNDGNPEPSGYWYSNPSGVYARQDFVMDLRNLPYEANRKDWRYDPPRANSWNAICPNQHCPSRRAGTQEGWYRYLTLYNGYDPLIGRYFVIPSPTDMVCSACHAPFFDTQVSPPSGIATGATYTTGDGIKTVYYDDEYEHDAFITAIKVGQLSTLKHGFSIDIKREEDDDWVSIVNVHYDGTDYHWMEWDDNGNPTAVSGSLPSVFKGAFTNGGVDMTGHTGFHFDVTRARYIRYDVSQPIKNINGSGGAPGTDQYVIGGTWKTDELSGATLWVKQTTDSDYTQSYTIGSNSGGVLTIQGSPAAGLTDWKISLTGGIASCSKFEVYGHPYYGNQVTITPPASTERFNLSDGVGSYSMYAYPTQITSVYAGPNQSAGIRLEEASDPSGQDFVWETKKLTDPDGIEYESITKGYWYYDQSTSQIIIPTTYKNTSDSNSGPLWQINDGLDQSIIDATKPDLMVVSYFDGAGTPMDIGVEAFHDGPSYQLEKEAICNILNNEAPNSLNKAVPPSSFGEILSSVLPSMGQSVSLTRLNGSKESLYWTCYNHEPTIFNGNVEYLIGNELGPEEWSETNIASLFGGVTQTDPGQSKISGRVTGTVTLYGRPNCLISGELVVYAKDMTKRRFVVNNEEVVTYERTGGLKYTGFSAYVNPNFSADEEDDENAAVRKGMCFKRPTVLVYLKERDITQEPDMGE